MVKRSLNKVEAQIETNVLKAWYDNGLLLREIRDDKLYKKKYGTFEEYADQRWGWKKSRAYQMIEAAERFQAIENVHQNGSLVDKILRHNANISHIRESPRHQTPYQSPFKRHRWPLPAPPSVLPSPMFPASAGRFPPAP